MGAYRSPEFAFDHILADYGDIALLTVETGEEDPNANGSGLFRIVDGQHARSTQIKASGSNPIQIKIDRLTAGQPNYTRLIIPVGHTFNGWDVGVRGGSTDPPVNDVLAATAVVSPNRIDITFAEDAEGAERFQMVRFINSPSPDLTRALPEIYLTNTVVPTRGPALKWDAPVRKNVQRFKGASGVGTSTRSGADQQTWRLEWTLVIGDDVTNFLTPLEQAVRPFWFLPPDNDFDWDIYEVEGDVRKSENFRASVNGPLVYTATALLVQVLG